MACLTQICTVSIDTVQHVLIKPHGIKGRGHVQLLTAAKFCPAPIFLPHLWLGEAHCLRHHSRPHLLPLLQGTAGAGMQGQGHVVSCTLPFCLEGKVCLALFILVSQLFNSSVLLQICLPTSHYTWQFTQMAVQGCTPGAHGSGCEHKPPINPEETCCWAEHRELINNGEADCRWEEQSAEILGGKGSKREKGAGKNN